MNHDAPEFHPNHLPRVIQNPEELRPPGVDNIEDYELEEYRAAANNANRVPEEEVKNIFPLVFGVSQYF